MRPRYRKASGRSPRRRAKHLTGHAHVLVKDMAKDFERKHSLAVVSFMDRFETCMAATEDACPPAPEFGREHAEAAARGRAAAAAAAANSFSDHAVLKLMHSAMAQASDRWQPLRILALEGRHQEWPRRTFRKDTRSQPALAMLRGWPPCQNFQQIWDLDEEASRSCLQPRPSP